MDTSSTPEGTGSTVADAAAKLEALLGGNADSGGDETLTEEAQEAEPDAEAEGDDPDAEEQSDDDAEDAEDTEEQPATVTVKIDGEEKQVTLDEVIRGYQREADYTRKTQALAETRKAFDAQVQSFSAERERTTSLLSVLEAQLTQLLYSPEDMEYLRVNDPAEWAARGREMDLRAQQLQSVTGEKQRLSQQAEREQQQAFDAIRSEEGAKLLAAKPEWADPVKGREAMTRVRDYMVSVGTTDDEIAQTFDHRILIAIDKAAQWDALQAKKPAVQARVEAVKTAKPGVQGQQPSKVTEATRAKQRLAKTGRVEDAATAIERMMR